MAHGESSIKSEQCSRTMLNKIYVSVLPLKSEFWLKFFGVKLRAGQEGHVTWDSQETSGRGLLSKKTRVTRSCDTKRSRVFEKLKKNFSVQNLNEEYTLQHRDISPISRSIRRQQSSKICTKSHDFNGIKWNYMESSTKLIENKHIEQSKVGRQVWNEKFWLTNYSKR